MEDYKDCAHGAAGEPNGRNAKVVPEDALEPGQKGRTGGGRGSDVDKANKGVLVRYHGLVDIQGGGRPCMTVSMGEVGKGARLLGGEEAALMRAREEEAGDGG